MKSRKGRQTKGHIAQRLPRRRIEMLERMLELTGLQGSLQACWMS